ncbi:MAG: MarR family transcriptional regulator [Coriobacteriales bacterium]|jgi:DNA-binding MarR family transcriptional regulator|nr:MarR family transcriptional regulator [Coriobacteriales bacterium]
MKQGLFTLNHLINNIYTTHALKAAIARCFDISLTEYCIFLELIKGASPGSPSHLSQRLGLTPSAVTLCLNHLEQRGLVDKAAQGDDARRLDIVLSASGLQLLPQIDREVAQVISDIWQPLTSAQRELLLKGSLVIVRMHRNIRLESGRVRADTLYAEAVLITYASLGRIARQHGLTLNSFSILFALARQRNPMRAMDVANTLLMRQNTLTASAKALLANNLVQLHVDAGDRRSHLLSITEEGNEVFFRAYRPMDALTHERMGTLDAQERREFKAIGDIFIAAERKRRALG